MGGHEVREIEESVSSFDGDLLAGETPADVIPVFDAADPTRSITLLTTGCGFDSAGSVISMPPSTSSTS